MSKSMSLQNRNQRTFFSQVSSFLTSAAVSVSVMATNAFATTTGTGGPDLFESGEQILGDFRVKLVALSGSLAAVVIAIAVIFWFVCNDNQKVRSMKDWAIRAFWGFVVLNITPSILNTIQGFLNGQGLT